MFTYRTLRCVHTWVRDSSVKSLNTILGYLFNIK
jgi:hypothetical protein